MLADDFHFAAGYIGPLSKAEFLQAFGSFKLTEALPDMQQNSWCFHVDPMEPNRVWWFARAAGTHTAPLGTGKAALPATNRRVRWCPQANSLLFNEQGQVYTLTVGYPMDKRIGNTGGHAAMFGLMIGIGKPLPFPEGNPWRASL